MTPAPAEASPFLFASFTAFGVTLAALFVAGVAWAGRRLHEPSARTRAWTVGVGIATVVWMAGTWAVADSGALANFDRRPPRMVLLFLTVAGVSGGVALSPVGTRLIRGLPLAALVAFQSFRLPLELLMHRAYSEGVMPEQMSYSGRNYDILTGASAVALSLWLARGGGSRAVVSVWNAAGAALLANILIIAIRSTPVFAAYGPDRLNTWVAYPPFIWLPTVMVTCALTGHLLVWRCLSRPGSGARGQVMNMTNRSGSCVR